MFQLSVFVRNRMLHLLFAVCDALHEYRKSLALRGFSAIFGINAGFCCEFERLLLKTHGQYRFYQIDIAYYKTRSPQ